VIFLKKIISAVLVAIMMLSIASVSVSAVDVEGLTTGEKALLTIQRADVNGDAKYSTDDVSLILKVAAGIIKIENEEYYDLDLDGYVSVKDAQLMLEVVTGVGKLITDEEALESFNTIINGVKTKKPGFNRTSTLVCPSVKITTSGFPIIAGSLNVTNMEYKDYVNRMVSLMGDSADVDELKQSAVEIYKPQTETKTIAASSNSHYTYFPVNNLGWSSKLTVSDINSITYTVSDGCIIYTVKMGDYTYGKGQYPSGSKGFSDRQKLPYGKIFNIPALSEDDETIVNSVQLKNGTVVLKADLATGNVVSVDYSYSYVTDVSSTNTSGNYTINMKTVTSTNVTEKFVMNVG
jgi:hypothetical protein